MPVKCPISSIVKQRKLQGRDCFEVSWEEMHGLKSSVVPVDLVERYIFDQDMSLKKFHCSTNYKQLLYRRFGDFGFSDEQ